MARTAAVMKNLVGPEEAALWPQILATPGLIPHHYGKTDARPGRKMGHVTRLFPRGSLPGPFAIEAALGPVAPSQAPSLRAAAATQRSNATSSDHRDAEAVEKNSPPDA